jgi:hypothetical protein
LRKVILVIAFLCCATLCFSGLAANPLGKELGLNQLKQSDPSLSSPANTKADARPSLQENIVVLKQDSGKNISEMNITLAVSPTYGSAQTVVFTPPKIGWKLQNVLVTATDGWNASSDKLPNPLPFTIEIRDANLKLLYHFSDTQLPYFTSGSGIRTANIEIPDLSVDGDFFVCFYGYRSLGLTAELENATGNSYLLDKLTGLLYPGAIPIGNNETLPVNWLIQVAGQ